MRDRADELEPVRDPADAVFDDLPVPGGGATPERFRALWNTARRSPSLGRIAEAHHDAIAILREAGRIAVEPGLHAVWAAAGPDPLRLTRAGERWRLSGSKRWCSGSTLASRALVTADTPNAGGALVLVDLARDGVQIGAPNWESPAMPAVDTRTVYFDLEVASDDIVGTDDWYLRRPGFWHGAIGVAACWAGCIDGIVDRLLPSWKEDSHAVAHLGAIDAALWTMRSSMRTAGAEIDADPESTDQVRHRRALRVRHTVDAAVGEVIGRVTRALGPAPLAHVPSVHRHLIETDLYRRQSHAERDLEVLGHLSMRR